MLDDDNIFFFTIAGTIIFCVIAICVASITHDTLIAHAKDPLATSCAMSTSISPACQVLISKAVSRD